MMTATLPLAVGPAALEARPKLWAKAAPMASPRTGDGAVGVALAGEHQLTQRAAAQQDAAKAGEQHAQEIPQAVGVGNGLPLQTQGEEGTGFDGSEHQV